MQQGQPGRACCAPAPMCQLCERIALTHGPMLL